MATLLAGMAAGKVDFITECSMFGLKDMTGAVIGPFEAFLINRGLKTLDIRVKKHCESALKLQSILRTIRWSNVYIIPA